MPKNINIAIVGFGNIGSYFYRTLIQNKKIISYKTGKIPFVKYISAKNLNKKRRVKIPKSKWIKNPLNLILKKDVDIVVELVGGSEGIAKKVVFSSLKNRKHVITANKTLMAKYGDKIKGDPTSFGNDVYMSTGEFEEPSGFIHAGRPSDFGIAMYQGNLTDINYLQLNIGYLINPATNFKIDFSIVKRDLVSEEQEVNTMFYSVGLKTDLFNHYYDF